MWGSWLAVADRRRGLGWIRAFDFAAVLRVRMCFLGIGKDNDNDRSKSPSGMTTREATATATAGNRGEG